MRARMTSVRPKGRLKLQTITIVTYDIDHDLDKCLMFDTLDQTLTVYGALAF